ncbi:Integrase core domain protein [Legionella clemsonensis]|uniref:Integrase core domain protein n=1 Tax=Legionella clemsonensis TaxID=1867846 RepID=A0A222P3L8_9GAMM|nr:Integrase core domain protein [Legionella clemsonensis]
MPYHSCGQAIRGEEVVGVLEGLRVLENKKPKSIRIDNGPEYISKLFKQWTDKNQIQLIFIQPGNPQQNAFIECYNRTVRYDWLSQY